LTLLLLGAASVSARAQQVFISRLWVHHKTQNCSVDPTKHQINCDNGAGGIPRTPQEGNISNNPNIQFDQLHPSGGFTDCENNATFPPGTDYRNFCNEKIYLCTQVGHANKASGSVDLALDFIRFELFQYKDGTNPLDDSGAPAERIFYVDNPGKIPANSDSEADAWSRLPPVCVMWDGSTNMSGEFGKRNAEYGFRATVETNQLTAEGNVKISQTRAYPGGWTEDTSGNEVDEKPVTVHVNNVHVVRTTPTVVGRYNTVSASPYMVTYRLSNDATTYVTIHQTDAALNNPTVRELVPGQPRVGEGTPQGTLRFTDAWDGRFDNGALGPPGVYLATVQSFSRDQFGADLSVAVTRQIALDTLQITDVRTGPLTGNSTALATISFLLTEAATAYVDIYPPGTQFLRGLVNVNETSSIPDLDPAANGGVQKDFTPCFSDDNGAAPCTNPAPLLRHMELFANWRQDTLLVWDGRDNTGRLLEDGDYVFVVYASLSSQNGHSFRNNANDRRIWSTNAKNGLVQIARGLPFASQLGVQTSVVGSSPAVAGLNPITFNYSVSRESIVSLKVLESDGQTVVRTIVDDQIRPGNFLNRERWDTPVDDEGLWIASGTYLAQLTVADPFFPAKVSTRTVMFPVDLYRITDVRATPLLTGATDVLTVSYQLTQPMLAALNIYPPGTVVSGSTASWPPCGQLEPGACWQITNAGAQIPPMVTIKGIRPGRLRITEFWDGRDQDGIFVPDGNYVFTIAAQSTTTPQYFAVDKVWGNLTVARGAIVFTVFNVTPTFPTLFNSSSTISLPSFEVDYSVTRQSSVTIQILTTNVVPGVARNLVVGQVRDANVLNRDFWDGRDEVGQFVEPGFYTVRAIAEDLASVLSSGSTAQVTISVDPLRIYDVAVSPLDAEFGQALVAYQVSETMKVAIKIYKPGTVFDANGNPTPPETTSLVKRIVGVREARREVTEAWDGTDESLSLVPDGNYLFKVIASTDMDAIDSITGDVVPGAVLAQDLVIAEIPVVRGHSLDPQADFEQNSFLYPNPIRSPTATFQIYVPIESRISMRMFNIAGDLVMERDFGLRAQDSYVRFSWDKTNQHGRKLAHGVYFYVLRLTAAKGEGFAFQTVRKLLIP